MSEGEAYTEITYQKGRLSVRLSGEIDHHTAKAVRESIDKALYLHRPNALILELARISFMDSSGLGLILGRVAVCERMNCHVYLTDIPPRVNRIFAMAGINRIPSLTLVSEKKENA